MSSQTIPSRIFLYIENFCTEDNYELFNSQFEDKELISELNNDELILLFILIVKQDHELLNDL